MPPQSVIETNWLQVKEKGVIVAGLCAFRLLPPPQPFQGPSRPIGGGAALLRGQTASHQARGTALKSLFSFG